MALRKRPHTVEVRPPVETGAEVELVPSFGGGVMVSCQVEPAGASRAFDQFGVEAQNPIIITCNLQDADTFAIDSRVIWNSLTYAVATRPQRFPTARLSHALVLCKEVRSA